MSKPRCDALGQTEENRDFRRGRGPGFRWKKPSGRRAVPPVRWSSASVLIDRSRRYFPAGISPPSFFSRIFSPQRFFAAGENGPGNLNPRFWPPGESATSANYFSGRSSRKIFFQMPLRGENFSNPTPRTCCRNFRTPALHSCCRSCESVITIIEEKSKRGVVPQSRWESGMEMRKVK